MIKFVNKYSDQINGYLFVLPAFLIIGLFGIFPVFFGMYMSVHKWKVFKGRFLGFENYQKIVGDIGSFWVFILGLLVMIASYWVWSEFKNKFSNKFYCLFISLLLLIVSLFLINISWADMMAKGDEDFLNSLIYIFYYSFFAITTEVGLGLLIAFALYQKLKGKQLFQMVLLFPYITPAVMGGAVFFIIFGKAENSILNEFIGYFGYDPQMWLFDKRKLSEILKDDNITVNCLHPGVVATGFASQNDSKFQKFLFKLSKPFMRSSNKGAETSIYLSSSDDVSDVSGKYFYNSKVSKISSGASNEEDTERLWRISMELTELV